MARKFKSLIGLTTLSSDPLSGSEGEVYFNVTTKNLKIHNGTTWVDLTPKSSDPAPFYMHTHTYDGDVHTINVSNQIKFDEFNETQSVFETIPAIIGFDGGGPSSVYDDPSYSDLTLLDGREIGN